MSHEYYYFVASLPALTWQEKPFISLEEFVSLARQLLTPPDFENLKNALYADPSAASRTGGLFGRWIAFNHQFHNAIAFTRAQRVKWGEVVKASGVKIE